MSARVLNDRALRSLTRFGVTAIVILGAAPATAGATQRGDTLVRQLSAPLHPNGGTLVRELHLGGAANPTVEFLSVYAMTIGRDGSVFVVDRGTPLSPGASAGASIRQFDGSGKLLRSFGRYGEGPGEWQTPIDVEVLPDNRVLVLSPRRNRILVYRPDGSYDTTWNAAGSGGDHTSNRLLTDAVGFTYLRINVRPDPAADFVSAFVRYNSRGQIVDTLRPPPSPSEPVNSLTARSPDGGTYGVAIPYMPHFTWVLTHMGYLASGVTSSYNINLNLPGTGAAPSPWRPGMPVTSLRRVAQPIPVSNGERDEYRRLIEEYMRTRDPRWTWNGPEIPRIKPAFSYVIPALDGRLWVIPHVASVPRTPTAGRSDIQSRRSFSEPPTYDVIDASGVFHGTVMSVDGLAIRAIRGDYVWGSFRDADGVESIARYRLVWR